MRRASTLLLATLMACSQSHLADPVDPIAPPEAPTDPTDPVDPVDPGRVVAPPPLSGGHMLVLSERDLAVVADPDRDRLHLVDLDARRTRTILLEPGDEPGRLVEDARGAVHVALRSSGAVVSLDRATLNVVRRRAVCAHPRGIAHDAATDELLVACAGGELVRMGTSSGVPVARFVDHDLRDVIVSGGRTYVTVFRSAELLEVDAEGAILARRQPAVDTHMMFTLEGELEGTFVPNVAWRTHGDGDGGAWMLHQASMKETVNVSEEGYSLFDPECETGLVATVLTHFPASGAPVSHRISGPGMAIDFAMNDDGFLVGMATQPADPTGARMPMPIDVQPGSRWIAATDVDASPCMRPARFAFQGAAQITAVGLHGDELVGWDRAAASVQLMPPSGPGTRIGVPGQPAIDDPGHELFHVGTAAMMACATCHPEGREDGHTWDFAEVVRRTQTLTGGILGTEPFHWSGDQPDMRAIMDETFTRRMSAPVLDDHQITQVATWLDTLPEVAAPARDRAAAARGEEAFVTEGCADCHAGPRFTNSESVDVGTGGAFQVPALLGLAVRGPWMHDGCAGSLAEVLDGCSGDPHGDVSSPAVRADLVAYLETL